MDINEPALNKSMQNRQFEHLLFAEKWGASFSPFLGVPVVQCITYDLVQVLNDLYLQDMVKS